MAKTLMKLLIGITALIYISCQFDNGDFNFRKCGKPNPEKETHCTNYGTDSDFLCCYIEPVDTTAKKVCGLVSYAVANKYSIKGSGSDTAGNKYKCGNNSFFLKLTPVLLGFLAFIIF